MQKYRVKYKNTLGIVIEVTVWAGSPEGAELKVANTYAVQSVISVERA